MESPFGFRQHIKRLFGRLRCTKLVGEAVAAQEIILMDLTAERKARLIAAGDNMTVPDEPQKKECIACRRNTDEVPLFSLEYRGSTFWICPQHFPVLIHRPADLIGLLPGAEKLRPSEIED